MGGESWDKDSLPVHPVEVDDFWIGQYPVTQALWTAVMGEGNNPSYFKGPTRPVETVSWDMIDQDFLPRLNQITENTRPPGTAYRLPTEAEWEYAARGGIHWKEKPYLFSGSEILDEVGWYDQNSNDETKPVGLKLPNELGIYDMSGNVWEWCEDQWHDTYNDAPDDGSAWVDQERGTYRVDRGGGWINNVRRCCPTHPLSQHAGVPPQRYRLPPRLVGPSSLVGLHLPDTCEQGRFSACDRARRARDAWGGGGEGGAGGLGAKAKGIG